MKTLRERKILTPGILICISCGSDKTIRDVHMLRCDKCGYANSYEMTA